MPEAILVEIIARLPLRSIARFKSVCKQWNSLIESPYFRRSFLRLSAQKLIFLLVYHVRSRLSSSHHRSYWLPWMQDMGSPQVSRLLYHAFFSPTSRYFYVASSNGLIWINVFVTHTGNMAYSYKSFVGNPVLQQWVEIPPPPDQCTATGLVSRVEENGVVSGFKVVRTCDTCWRTEPRYMGMYVWRVFVYSSETGTWTFKRLLSSHPVKYTGSYPPVNLNGTLYLRETSSDPTEPGVLVAHDFYGPEDDDRCLVIPLPLLSSKNVRRCLTTSGEDVIYVETLCQRLKVWRLNNNCSRSSEWWQLSREEINMASVGFYVDCFPMAMNPLDNDIVYLWSRHHECLVSGNLRTQSFIVHQESESWSNGEGCWRIDTSDSKGYVEDNRNVTRVIMLSPFVFQPWMDSVPRPPN